MQFVGNREPRRRFAWELSQASSITYSLGPEDRDGLANVTPLACPARPHLPASTSLMQSVMASLSIARRPGGFLLWLARPFQRARRRARRCDTIVALDARSHALLKIVRVVRWK